MLSTFNEPKTAKSIGGYKVVNLKSLKNKINSFEVRYCLMTSKNKIYNEKRILNLSCKIRVKFTQTFTPKLSVVNLLNVL